MIFIINYISHSIISVLNVNVPFICFPKFFINEKTGLPKKAVPALRILIKKEVILYP